MAGPFEESWDEFRRRAAPRYPYFCKCLRDNYSPFISEVTSLLDIGPGEGDFDVMLINEVLPNLTHYNAVESDGDLCKTLTKKISDVKDRDIKVDIFQGFMELYGGPSQPVDLIIMCAVAYYVPDKKKMIEDALSWLQPGDRFVMIHTLDEGGMPQAIRSIPGKIDSSFDGAPLLSEIGLKYTEHKLNVPFDVTEEGLDRMLHVALNRAPTEEETKKFSVALDPYSEVKDGRRYVDITYSLLVVPKDQ